MCNYKIDAEVVFRAAKGRWDEVLWNLAPMLRPALEACPKHVPCPIHGGENGFRFFKDYKTDGQCICNTCGAFDGIHILMKVNGWDFYRALKAVNDYLQVPEDITVDSEIVTYDGKVTFADMATLRNGHQCFCLKLKLENGRNQSCWGVDLKRACSEAEVSVGDNLRVTKIGTKSFQWKGREVKKTLWTVRKLASDAEREQEEKRNRLEIERRGAAIASKWAASAPLRLFEESQKPLALYLQSRGIYPTNTKALTNLRFLLSETYFDDDGKAVGKYPCMVCAVRNKKGELITLHRTFLTKEGQKIGFGTAKKLMAVPLGSTINGAFIRFGEVAKDGIVCVAEGVETALSVYIATGFACFSAISAQGMTAVDLPENVKMVFIFADKDKSLTGQKAADKLRKRMDDAGIPCVICLPNDALKIGEKGVDWNDVLRQHGAQAFPFHRGNTCFEL